MRVLVTRPAAEARATALRLLALGHAPLLSPVLEIVPLAGALPQGPFDAVLATSANAFRARLSPLALPLHVAGAQTAGAALEAGWPQASTVALDSRALAVELAHACQSPARLLYLAGRDRKSELEAILTDRGHVVAVAETYAAQAASALQPDVAAALAGGRLDAVLHYSRRSACMFMALAAAAGVAAQAARLAHHCLSRDVAAPLARWGAADVRVAARPQEASLLRSIGLR